LRSTYCKIEATDIHKASRCPIDKASRGLSATAGLLVRKPLQGLSLTGRNYEIVCWLTAMSQTRNLAIAKRSRTSSTHSNSGKFSAECFRGRTQCDTDSGGRCQRRKLERGIVFQGGGYFTDKDINRPPYGLLISL